MEVLGVIVLVICVGGLISKWAEAYNRHEEAQRMKRLKRRNPRKWMRLQEAEHQQQQMEHDRQMMELQKKAQERADFEKGLKIGKSIFDAFFKK